jgi:hypothetical protein
MELTAYMTVVLGFYQGASVYEKVHLSKQGVLPRFDPKENDEGED